MELDLYKLNRWSRLVRLRDKGKCFMCGETSNIFKMAAHHIYPKGDPRYIEKAYDLNNGITLCWNCHRKVVHSSWTNWRKFGIMFKQYIKRKGVREFNARKKEKVK